MSARGGFVYGVSLMGVTGERASLADQAAGMGKRLKATTDKPALLGIGISNAEQAVEASQSADGVIVGSALMSRVMEGGADAAHEFVSGLRSALDRVIKYLGSKRRLVPVLARLCEAAGARTALRPVHRHHPRRAVVQAHRCPRHRGRQRALLGGLRPLLRRD
ncbi:MAG: tryptophan synthase subunit alpha [Acidimicrobiia bacterium]